VTVKRFFLAQGKVQGVMFRQTVIRGAHKRKLRAGATNLPGGTQVAITLDGDDGAIDDIVAAATKLQPLNSWGAAIETLTELESGRELEEHQVTTDNVDDFSWNPNVEMFL
jgi:acylphosphatase